MQPELQNYIESLHIPEPTSTAYVYIWRQKSTQKWYVGVRFRKGCNPTEQYYTSSKHVRSLIKSNPNDWERQLIYIGDPKIAQQMEIDVLKEFNAKHHRGSFNLTNGDNKFVCKGHTDETKEKLRQHMLNTGRQPPSAKGRIVTEKTRAKKRGFKHSEETITKLKIVAQNRTPEHLAKIGLANKGRKLSPEHIAKMHTWKKGRTPWNKGQKYSKETCKKIGESKKGNQYRLGSTHTEEARRKISEAGKNRIVSDETKAKHSAAMKGRVISSEWREKIRQSNIGKAKPVVLCEYCNKYFSPAMIKRWHGDNCKHKR